MRARNAVRGVHVGVARGAEVRLRVVTRSFEEVSTKNVFRDTRASVESRVGAWCERAGWQSGKNGAVSARVRELRREARASRKRASRGNRRSHRVAEDDRRPTRTRVEMRLVGVLFFSRRSGMSEHARASAIETAPAAKYTCARVPCPAHNTPPPVSGARCRTPRTGATSDGATRVYFCCESGRRTLYRGRRCRCSNRRRLWRCCTACKTSSCPL